jgi:stalled ribosome rescue protein Dom34
MDSKKAMLFNMTANGQKSHLENEGPDHHTQKKDQTTDSNLNHFYKNLVTALKDAKEILIMGPGQSKEHFKKHVESHHTADLADRIKGIENSDHPTDNQILAAGRSFFKMH